MATENPEKKLQESRERFRLLVENALDVFFFHDAEGRFLEVNERAYRQLGYSREELLELSVIDISTGLTLEKNKRLWADMLPGAAVTVHSEYVRRNGSSFPVEVWISCHVLDGEKVFMGMARDISDRVRAEAELRKLHEELEARLAQRTRELSETSIRLSAVLEGVQDHVFLKDLNNRYLLCNRASAEFAGSTPEAMVGLTSQESLGNTGTDLEDPDRTCIETRSIVTREESLHYKGVRYFFLTTRTPCFDAEGNIFGTVGIARDVTDRKKMELELRTERERLTLATRVSGLGIWDYDITNNILFCDDRWYEIMGRSPTEPVTDINSWKKWIHPDDAERATEVDLKVLSEMLAHREEYSIVFRIVRPDGEIRWIRSAACLVGEEHGVPTRAIGVIADITESHLAKEKLQRSYDALRRAEKIARVGSWELDLKTYEFSTSDMLYEMNGFDSNGPAIKITDLQEMLKPSDAGRLNDAIQRSLLTGQSYDLDLEHLRPDGGSFIAHIRGQAIHGNDGEIIRLAGTVQDISEREEARAQLESLADNVPSGAIFLVQVKPDNSYGFGYFSRGLDSLLGLSSTDIMESSQVFESIIHGEDISNYRSNLRNSIASRSLSDQTFRVYGKDGKILWMHSRAVPRSLSSGRTVWDGILRDVTQEREAAETLSRAKIKAEEAGRAKSDFLATMSHEIRTPMNTVIGMTRLALQTELSMKQRNYLGKIDASAKTLLGIINNVLDFSKIESGHLQLENVDFTLESVFDAVSASTALRADEKDIETVYRVSSGIPHVLRGDPLRVSQILINLVGNAIKFTDAGEIVVTSDIVKQAGLPMLRFSVQDTGIGMNQSQLAGLFQPFTQAHSGARTYGGTGLGLSICKRLVEKMGGEIRVNSEPNVGSTFTFTVPLFTGKQPLKDNSSLRGRTVLVVDDNASARETLASMAEAFGMRADVVSSGEDALRALRRSSDLGRSYDLVLMDWRMPDMDGIEAARRIRADRDLQALPAILMVTAYALEEIARQIEKLDLQGLLIKPVTSSMMLNTIQHVFGVNQSNSSHGSLQPSVVLGKLAGKRILVVDDNLLNQEVASDFLEIAGAEADRASSGADAIKRLQQQSYDAVLMDVHMPHMDGLETTQVIRKNPAWALLPIIALTAQTQPEDRAAIVQAGMNGYLSKPIDETLLYEMLESILFNKSASKAEVTTRIDEGLLFDRDVALSYLGGRSDRLARLMHGFIRDLSDTPDQIQEAVSRGDWNTIAELAHLIKGASGYFGAKSLMVVAEGCERSYWAKNFSETLKLAPLLESRLRSMLTEMKEDLDRSSLPERTQSSWTSASKNEAYTLIKQLEPMIATGDYAVEVMLDRLGELIKGHAPCSLLKQLRVDFEDLNLESAHTVLFDLKQQLGELDEDAI